ncbi:VOC family protein [Flavobacterium terrae]|uniref:Catechol 2,3-dioxygenase n=1 Tax=Flavobacterium terrae TaxID=415425 RepID=A0A1M6CN16_9FLAO|nr:VOC family protein [Flavobacterium terrae]SHI62241.1 Catechol 2,3-dioxygenase [Flavobacterium terrae]
MNHKISHISIVVDDYDKAIEFYTKKLRFVLMEDTIIDKTKRWVKIAPDKKSEFSLLLAKASNKIQKTRVGNQTGGRVFLFLNTNDFEKDYENLLNENVKIIRKPKIEAYGKVLVFEDCYGNLWDLIEPFEEIEEKFYLTEILRVIKKQNIEVTKNALIELQKHTKNESGNVTFEIQQSIENENEFIIWKCFKNKSEFKKHLDSKHLNDFMKLNLVKFIKEYTTKEA